MKKAFVPSMGQSQVTQLDRMRGQGDIGRTATNPWLMTFNKPWEQSTPVNQLPAEYSPLEPKTVTPSTMNETHNDKFLQGSEEGKMASPVDGAMDAVKAAGAFSHGPEKAKKRTAETTARKMRGHVVQSALRSARYSSATSKTGAAKLSDKGKSKAYGAVARKQKTMKAFGPPGETLMKPEPEKKEGESSDDYMGRLISHYRHTGRPQDQATAIAAKQAGVAKADGAPSGMSEPPSMAAPVMGVVKPKKPKLFKIGVSPSGVNAPPAGLVGSSKSMNEESAVKKATGILKAGMTRASWANIVVDGDDEKSKKGFSMNPGVTIEAKKKKNGKPYLDVDHLEESERGVKKATAILKAGMAGMMGSPPPAMPPTGGGVGAPMKMNTECDEDHDHDEDGEKVEKALSTRSFHIPRPGGTYDPFQILRSATTQTNKDFSKLYAPEGVAGPVADTMQNVADSEKLRTNSTIYKSCSLHGVTYRAENGCHPCKVAKSYSCQKCQGQMVKAMGGISVCANGCTKE